jgi:hypothetical protein
MCWTLNHQNIIEMAQGHISLSTGPAAKWWDSYCASHATADTITWAEFSTNFRNYHILARLMKIKEFLSLRQEACP